MSIKTSDAKQYFLGIEGQQKGPLSEQTLVEQIQQDQVPEDALIWWEGQKEWVAVSTIEPFKGVFSGTEYVASEKSISQPAGLPSLKPLVPQKAPPPADSLNENEAELESAKEILQKAEEAHVDNSAAKPTGVTQAFEPVLSSDESEFVDPSFIKKRTQSIAALVGSGILILFLLFVWIFNSSSVPEFEGTEVASTGKKISAREIAVRQAISQINVDPQKSLKTLRPLIKSNPTDTIAKQATEAMLTYYKTRRDPLGAGDTLMLAQRPEEALPLYLNEDDPNPTKAAQAMNAAIQAAKDPKKKQKYLVQQTELYLGSLAKPKLAQANIKRLQSEFPNQPHPFGYYLQSDTKKVTNLFSRMSLYFVQTLMANIESEFPQLTLKGQPKIKLNRTKNKNYRFVGSYTGEVLVQRNKIPNVNLEFWLWDEEWQLVATNITPLRKKKAAATRRQLRLKSYNTASALSLLEQLFKTQFPDRGLHESLSNREITSSFQTKTEK